LPQKITKKTIKMLGFSWKHGIQQDADKRKEMDEQNEKDLSGGKCYFCGSSKEECGELRHDPVAFKIHNLLGSKSSRTYICADCLQSEDYLELKRKAENGQNKD
jgi:glutamyl/glutaminyl-tRNA synthetase